MQCPHCGNIQLESELAKSTYCRKCNGYVQLGKDRKSIKSQEAQKQPLAIQKLGRILGGGRMVVARCFECMGKREVSKSVTSTICPQCGAYIDLQEYKIIGSYSRSIRTRNKLIITNKGDLNSNQVICDSANIQGIIRGSLICSGEVHIKFKGKMSGSIEAKTVYIDRKCKAEFVRPIRANLVEIEGNISAWIISDGKVIVQKTGQLTGAVFSRKFTVEKGGKFFGELSIGKVEVTQGKLLNTLRKKQGESKIESPGSDFSLIST